MMISGYLEVLRETGWESDHFQFQSEPFSREM